MRPVAGACGTGAVPVRVGGSVANTSCAQYDDEGLMGAMMGMEGGLEREKALVEADFFNKFEGTRRTYSGRVPMLCCACRASHMWCR